MLQYFIFHDVKSMLRYDDISTVLQSKMTHGLILVPYGTVPYNTESYFYIYYISSMRTTSTVPEH